MKKNLLRLLVALLAAVLVISLTLSVTEKIHPLVFWILIGVIGLFAFKVLPRMNKGP